ncbi:hypothetical protein CKM354_000450500 [Cercospora kikuchii]|uniref:Amino acid transporter n=1 Tax=Cercospora kikuchii TaxID=84275 RepID=A0A9P3FBD9_9PEZI|nr:uncharacterized protein CKM354_000450500 [Cercospora kikuchii]GIZ41191.1 hypothetical protein CKM354_000450500 [Cercospora kikuchii]
MQPASSTLTLRPHLPIAHDSDFLKPRRQDTPSSDEFIFSTKRRPARLSMDFRPVEPEVLLSGNSNILFNGGLPGLVWSTIFAHIGQLFIVLSLAEISSMVPTGGQYRWASAFAPPRYQQVLSYFTGSLCSIGWQARLTAICHILAGVVLALVEINHDDFSPARWQRNLLTFGIVIVVSAFNALAASHLSVAEGLFAICHVYALVPIVVSLWVLAPKQSVADVFFNCTDNGGGWPSPVLGVLVGQIPAFFTVLGSEATVHISEEVEEPETVLPRCMLWSYLANLPGTLLLLLTYAFNVSDLEVTAEAIVPFASVLSMALQSAAATTGFLVVVMSLLFMIAVSTMVTTSRHLFAFGRDRAFYSAPWFGRVDARLQVPLNAIYSSVFFALVLILATIATTAPLNTMMGLTVATLMTTYIIVIGSLIRRRLRGDGIPRASWSLGRAGIWINAIAVLYSVWAFFWSFWPTMHSSNAADMNWTILLYCFVVAYALCFFISGQRRLRQRPMEMMPSWTPR